MRNSKRWVTPRTAVLTHPTNHDLHLPPSRLTPYLYYHPLMYSITPLDERRRLIAEARQQPSATEYVFLQGRYQSLPVVELPLGLPLYRAGNGRLAVLEADYIQGHELTPDYFTAGEETPGVQQVLHAMLLELAKNPEAAIYRELHDSALQTERLLVTGDGVVLDGNRRLAAMRELCRADPDTYGSFNRVEAVLLPDDVSDTDLEMVEAAKQMAPDLKLAYSWVDRRLKLRHHRDELGIPVETICGTYRLESGEDLDHEIEELELAEDYLENYLGEPRHYKAVDYAEDHFIGLREQLATFQDPDVRRTWRLVGFAMIKEAGVLSIDAEQQFPFAPSKPPYAPVPALELYGGENDLLPYTRTLGSGAVLRKNDYKTLADALNNPEESHNVARQFIHLFSQIQADHNERPHPIAVVNRLKQANQMLGRLELEQFTESQRSELFGQLAETAYLFRYLTQQEDHDSARPIVVTGFSPLINPIVRFFIRVWLWLKARLRRLTASSNHKS